MKSSGTYILLIAWTLLLCSCSLNERRIARERLTTAEAVMEERPDSALTALQSIPDPGILPEAEQHYYNLLLLRAKDKCDQDIAADTSMVETQAYFANRNEWSKAALTAFCHGRVWQERNDDKRAMQAYLEAKTYADHTNQNRLKGMIRHNIAWLYDKQQEYNTAIPIFKEALYYAQMSDSSCFNKYIIAALQLLGNIYFSTNQLDSTLFYHNKALDLAICSKDSIWQSTLCHNLSITHRTKGNSKKAEYYLKRATNLYPNGVDKARLYITLAKFYTKKQLFDSSLYYINHSLQLLDTVKQATLSRASALHAFCELAAAQGNYKQALHYNEQYTEEVLQVYKDAKVNSIIGLQEKYDWELAKNANQELQIRNQHMLLAISTLIILLLLTGGIFYYTHTKKKTALLAALQQIEQFKLLANAYNDKDNALKNIALHHFDVIKKVSLLENTLNPEEKQNSAKLLQKFKKIVYNHTDDNFWKDFYSTVNNYYNGKLDNLQQSYPDLDESEVRVYCLALAGLRTTEIALLMNCAESTIRLKKTNIRKKLKLEQGVDLVSFLQKIS